MLERLILGIVLVLMSSVAYADGTAVYTRKEALCRELKYDTLNCDIKYENERYLAEVTIMVDEDIDEPGAYSSYSVSAGSVNVRFPHLNESVSDIFMPITGVGDWGEVAYVWMYRTSHPCFTVECVEAKRAEVPNYDGVSEQDLTDRYLIEAKLPFQMASGHMLTDLQSKLNTTGIPVITKVKSINVVSSNVNNPNASVIRAVVTVRIAKQFVGIASYK